MDWRSVFAVLRSVVVVVLTMAYTVVAGAIFIPHALLTGESDTLYRAGVLGVRFCLWLAGVKCVVEGRENLRPGAPCIYVCNHVSNADPPAVIAVLPRVVPMAKREIWRVPVFGTAISLAKFIPVERGTERAALAVEIGVERLKAGYSVLAFPEGTRSPTGEMLPFRHGIFLMAIRAGAPVVPITILGSREIMQKGKPGIRPGTVRFVAHAPVATTGLREEDRGELADRVREIIASALPRG